MVSIEPLRPFCHTPVSPPADGARRCAQMRAGHSREAFRPRRSAGTTSRHVEICHPSPPGHQPLHDHRHRNGSSGHVL